MFLYKHSKLLTPSEKLATEENVLNAPSKRVGQGTVKPSTMPNIWTWDNAMRLMVECNDLRRRSASNNRNERIRIVFNPKNNMNMKNIANAIKMVLPLLLALSHGTHFDFVVRENPGKQDWHSRDALRKPKSVAQELFL